MANKLHEDDKKVIDSLLRDTEGDSTALFNNEAERLALVYQFNKERSKRWEKIGKCYFPLCSNNAIKKSHSLSNKLMIHPISKDGHVFGPKFNAVTGKYDVAKISVGKASVFPGFCEHHEKLFTFEKEGEMSNGKELQMQLFRSICRQLFFLKHDRDNVGQYLKDMRKLLLASVEKSLSLAPLLKTSTDELKSYIDSKRIGNYDLQVEQRDKDITYTEETWYKPNADGFGNLLSGNFYDELIVCTTFLPIVFSAPILFDDCPRHDNGTPNFDYAFYVIIFHNKGKTHVYMVSLKKQKDKLKALAASFEKEPILHAYLRNRLLKDCDHWYLSPKFWNDLDENSKKRIIEGLNTDTF